MESQNTDEEFADVHALNDENCKLDFAEFVLRCQIPHREYRHLWELMSKWLPADVAFPATEDGAPHGRNHPAAFLLRLVKTRKSLEEYMDKRIAAHRQASLDPPTYS